MFLTMSQEPVCNAWQAISSAMAVLEQAESRPILGPWRLKNQLRRFASMLRLIPSAA
jgi:hypothetical protein